MAAHSQTWSILINASTSDSIDTESADLTGFTMPAALTSTIATFTGSNDDTTFVGIDWEGAPVSLTVAASRGCGVDSAKFTSWRYIKIVVDQAEGAARAIAAHLREF